MRVAGFYWVVQTKTGDPRWEPAEWIPDDGWHAPGYWYQTGWDVPEDDDAFSMIGGRVRGP